MPAILEANARQSSPQSDDVSAPTGQRYTGLTRREASQQVQAGNTR
ncbi:MAG: hypothetical protein ACXWP0_11060 [Ktedonobacterales bacterium]